MMTGLMGSAWLAIFGDRSAGTDLVALRSGSSSNVSAIPSANAMAETGQGASSSASVEASSGTMAVAASGTEIIALQARPELIGDIGDGNGAEALFSSKSWSPPPAPVKPAPPPAPVAPPLPFTYLGKQTAGGLTKVFLARGDEVFIVDRQSIIQNTYRVESIDPQTITLVYLPLNQVQKLSIGVTN